MNKKTIILIVIIFLNIIGLTYLVFFKEKKNNDNSKNPSTNSLGKEVSYNYGGINFTINKDYYRLERDNKEEVIIKINGTCSYANGLEYHIEFKDKYYVNNKEIIFNIVSDTGKIEVKDGIIISNKIDYNKNINDEINFYISVNKNNFDEEDSIYLKNNTIDVILEVKGNELKPSMINKLKEQAVMDNITSEFVKGNGIDFLKPSSDTNGKGLYIRSGTENDEYPILYYRGAVENNYLSFAGFLWRIVRTTDTGGIKIVYEDTLDSGKKSPGRSAFAGGHTLPIHNGYMYGTKYQWGKGEGGFGSSSGDTVTYSNGVYTITSSGNKNGYGYYVCETRKCSSVRYYYCNYEFNKGEYGAYFTLSSGEDMAGALLNMQKGENNSTIKNAIDNWYQSNLLNYGDYLEDTIFCNDRSANINGPDKYTSNCFDPNLGDGHGRIFYGGFGRVKYGGNPSLSCRKIDAFTVKETEKGNGNLTYPIALLTSDELNLAGAVFDEKSTIYINGTWTMSPYYFAQDITRHIALDGSKLYELYPSSQSFAYKPVVSLKNGVMLDGIGTKNNPYKIMN